MNEMMATLLLILTDRIFTTLDLAIRGGVTTPEQDAAAKVALENAITRLEAAADAVAEKGVTL
jgi:hypothetical protein